MKWDGKTKAPRLGMRIFEILIKVGGIIPAYFILSFVALVYTFKNNDVKRNLRSYRKKLGLKTNFFNFYVHNFAVGFTMVDRFAHLIKKKSPFRFENIGEEHLHNALANQKGLILLSAHIGNQEVAGDVLFERIQTKVNYFMLDNESEAVKQLTNRLSESRNVAIVPTNSDPFSKMIAIKKAIEHNEIVCMLGDRVFGEESSKKQVFLGQEAEFPTFPFEIAALTGAPIIAVVTVKTGLYRYRQKVYEYISFDGINRKNRADYIQTAMQKYVTILEQIVRETPYQWFNFYDFWNEFDSKE